jgi:putative membrane protein
MPDHNVAAAFAAFLHHVAAFGLVAALALEASLLRGALTVDNARRLLRADLMFGIAAGVVVLVGIARVLWFAKGPEYYLNSLPFLLKMALFVLAGLLSIVPTIEFLSWRKAVRAGRLPTLAPGRLFQLRSLVMLELVAVVLLILCAALMARGIGPL